MVICQNENPFFLCYLSVMYYFSAKKKKKICVCIVCIMKMGEDLPKLCTWQLLYIG